MTFRCISMIEQRVTKSKVSRHDDSRYWKVVSDPANLFTGNLFRLVDLKAGGFDAGTVFEHIRTGERRVSGANGIARKYDQDENSTPLRCPARPALHRVKTAPGALRSAGNPDRRLPA